MHNSDPDSNSSAWIASTTEPSKLLAQGSRRELVWKSQSMQNVFPHISLCTISRQFQAFLVDLNTTSKPTLHRYRGRYAKRTAHRCPGYIRVEITLTTDITQSAIVSHSTPTAQEICPVCNEVVTEEEIFNCICGREGMSASNALFMLTVRFLQMMSPCLLYDARVAVNGITDLAWWHLSSKMFCVGDVRRISSLVWTGLIWIRRPIRIVILIFRGMLSRTGTSYCHLILTKYPYALSI